MPRRYGSRRRYSGRRSYGGSRRRPTARAAFFRTSSRRKTAGWRWLLTGVLVGTVTTGMLYLNEHPLDEWRPVHAQASQTKAPEQQAKAETKRTYAFYKLLSKPTHASEKPLQQSSVPAIPVIKAQPKARVAQNRTPAKPKPKTPAAPAVRSVGKVHLQLASFPKRADAKRMQSQLKAQGVACDIEIAQVKGRVWYRVQSPRLPSDAAAVALKRRLQRFGVNASLVHHG